MREGSFIRLELTRCKSKSPFPSFVKRGPEILWTVARVGLWKGPGFNEVISVSRFIWARRHD